MSAQEAELVGLLEAIKVHPKSLCVYTDSRYAFGVVHEFMVQWQLRKFLTAVRAPVKHFKTISAMWDAIQARTAPLSVVKVRAHITKDPNVHELQSTMADHLAKLAATCGEDWQQDTLPEAAVCAVQATLLDLKQNQKELWEEGGELVPHLRQDSLVMIAEGIVLRNGNYVVPDALRRPVLKLYHEYALVSAEKTLQLIKRHF